MQEFSTRTRRLNAGRRWRELLDQEMSAEYAEIFADEADDVDFEDVNAEEDSFDSDFASTASSASEDEDGDAALEAQERQAAKAARAKQAITPFAVRRPPQKNKRLLPEEPSSTPSTPQSDQNVLSASLTAVRASSRHSAIQYRQEVDQREKDDEQRRAALAAHLAHLAATKPKKKRPLTQAELIEEALQTEELNTASLRAFYQAEEERRQQQTNLARWEVIGPKVRFLSRLEYTNTNPPIAKHPLTEPEAAQTPTPASATVVAETPVTASIPTPTTAQSQSQPLPKIQEPESPKQTSNPSETPISSTQADNQPSIQVLSSTTTETNLKEQPQGLKQNNDTSAQSPTTTVPTRPHTRNFLIIAEYNGATKAQEMHALFGDHCEWAKAKAIPAKHRLVHRRQATCMITGLPAPYKDPLTGVPYANPSAFRRLRETLDHKHIFSEKLGIFVGTQGIGSYFRPPSPSPPPEEEDNEVYEDEIIADENTGIIDETDAAIKSEVGQNTKKNTSRSKKKSKPTPKSRSSVNTKANTNTKNIQQPSKSKPKAKAKAKAKPKPKPKAATKTTANASTSAATPKAPPKPKPRSSRKN